MTTDAYRRFIGVAPRDRLDLFLSTANRLGTPIGNIEKDFWVCWTLDALYHRLPANGPRLLFKGGTSLSKAHGLINRFSEDIDVTVFRDDLDQSASVEELEKLSANKRKEKLSAIRDACRNYIRGPLHEALSAAITQDTQGGGRIEFDDDDRDGQTLLVWYPEVQPRSGSYIRPAVRIESGAKSALDPNLQSTILPYVSEEISDFDFSVPNVTTIEPGRTFWDKVVIAHGLRRWYERRGELRHAGQRISRHYYDLHCIMRTPVGQTALGNLQLGEDSVAHARMFFDRQDFDLASARPGSFAIAPVDDMIDALRRDYSNTTAMIFGAPPLFEDILGSIRELEAILNAKT